ncbi:BnaA05g31650D [Brassica napus]|uniref:BnaA05g31650D protein n=1 Tax=Brassica napus TaxID=3708 RepID=A0A078GQR8_BRANA|nr:transcription termination factor MTERF15, mitochondrial-like [Brassica napus]CDY27756.1 BnaA05g31650D [Brassica napus]
MYSSLLLHGKKCIELHKSSTFRVISVKLLQKEYPFRNPFSSSASTLQSDSVLNLLTSYGFTSTQISKIITTYPRLLTLDAKTTLLPKLQSLQSRGASTSELTEIISKVPKILSKRGTKSTGLYFDFIKDIIHNDGKSSHSSTTTGKQGNKMRNVSVLRDMGVPQRFLFTLLVSESQPVCGKEKFEMSVKKVVEMGFDPATSKFVQALHVFYEMSERTIEEKVNVYNKLGFRVEEVWEMFNKWPYYLKFSERKITQTFETLKRCGLGDEEVVAVMKKRPECMRASEEKIRSCVETFLGLGFSGEEFVSMVKCFPTCVGLSAENVRRKVEFLVGEMKWELKDVVGIPPVLGYSLEKRMVPRCGVVRALVEKGVMSGRGGGGYGGIPPMSSVLACSDKVFLNRFVMKHGRLVPELMAIFDGDKEKGSQGRTAIKNVKGLCVSVS